MADDSITSLKRIYQDGIVSERSDISKGASPIFRYCIASAPRTGSTLLAKMLTDTDRAGKPEEYFNQHTLAAWRRLNKTRDMNVFRYIPEIENRRTSSNGYFGIKIHWRHLQMMMGESCTPENVRTFLAPYQKFIFMMRRDKLAQAISYYCAVQTGVFHDDQQEWLKGKTRVALINSKVSYFLHDMFAQEEAWRNFLKSNSLSFIEVFYEDLASDFTVQSRRVLDFLGLEDVVVPAPGKKKMTIHDSAGLKAQFIEALGISGICDSRTARND